ncbi:hypothetical protein EG328_007211 [Venturia inaequalis]|uniref:Uncharacterized protein n=1 Tax=Venturia inaequalis TaxID=5025 RepID=A0A8H3YR30_VENIN|nr:hypothetical protein EG328_007211 [Venturia inaequalis]RDI83395.1 hypothetical protein Vi05172_g6774 [Venturia inaequalis]
MSRFITTTARNLINWMGYQKEALPPYFQSAVEHYAENGAVKKVGEVKSIEILHRNDGTSPIHQSSFNPKDKANIISARVTPANGGPIRTHHIYEDGTGTFKKGDKREYSTSSK